MKIHYVSGSRADFGLMQRCLQAIEASPNINLELVVTGQHLSSRYGDTISEVRKSGLSIAKEIPVELSGTDGAQMAIAMSQELAELTAFWVQVRPDLILLLGDRGEMVAAALAAVHLGIFVAHIHGGERSGTLDESFRHVISKLAHYHFPATEEAADRLRRMGECPDSIQVIGAPGLVGITEGVDSDKTWLYSNFGLPEDKPVALVVFHPVVQEAVEMQQQIDLLLESLLKEGYAAIVLRPNSDAGGQIIDRFLNYMKGNPDLYIAPHLNRNVYLRVMASVDLVIGNSSSGIIESASFDVPCINLGSRQSDRMRNRNTIDCSDLSLGEIRSAIRAASKLIFPIRNSYGDGTTDRKLVEELSKLDMDKRRLKKRNAY